MQEFDENYKDKINDKLSKLQALLMQAATQAVIFTWMQPL